LWHWLQTHAVEGIAKAMLPCDTDIVTARYVGTAFTYLFLDDALRTGSEVLPESNGCRGLLSCHSNEETREDNDGHSHVFLISPDLHAFVTFEASSGTDAPQPTAAAPPRIQQIVFSPLSCLRPGSSQSDQSGDSVWDRLGLPFNITRSRQSDCHRAVVSEAALKRCADIPLRQAVSSVASFIRQLPPHFLHDGG
jgi:hypothetical protein